MCFCIRSTPGLAPRASRGRRTRGLGAAAWAALTAVAAVSLVAAGSQPAQDQPAPQPGAEALVTPTSGHADHVRLAPRVRAVRLNSEITLDGRLDEPIWSAAPAATGFIQREPNEGRPATQRTEVRFVFDEQTLYIGARMHDEQGARGVVSRLVRRDNDTQSDELTITFDTFHDHVGQTVLTINPAGVRGDAYGPGGSNPNSSWDPVWRVKTEIDDGGWTAEAAIPFSQLRFPSASEQQWGLQIRRWVKRLNEGSVWSFWRLNESGGPSRYGHLDGIEDVEARTNRIELLPYVVGQLDVNGTADPDDPFRSDTENIYRIGADMKYLLSSNVTLNATVNPDFGQAEVDPAVVNLSAFETFFPEKREFFIEGSGLFSFGGLWCFFCSNTSSLSMLFTRRIGRPPQAGFLATGAGEFADVPVNTTILGAGKVTGRTRGGTSLGILGALTQRERARVRLFDGTTANQEVEPQSGYFVGRVKQDFKDGDLQVGGIVTSVYRDFDDPALEPFLTRHSEGFGIDAEYWWKDRTYHWLFSSAVTSVSGTPEAILRAQNASARYFQRPDRDNDGNGFFTDTFDPELRRMRGFGFYSRVAKDAGDWQWETSLNVRSPGFENNDIAFLTSTDFVYMNANVVRTWTVPGSWYREIWTTLGAQQKYNFDGDLIDRQLHGSYFVQAPFYWNFNTFAIYRPSTYDDRLTRGGPVVRKPDFAFVAGSVSTDSRKPVIVSLDTDYFWDDDGGAGVDLGVSLSFKPRSNVNLSLNPFYARSTNPDQYVTAVDDPTATEFFGRRYVFAELDQRTVSVETRLDWTFTPRMTLELFLQPLIVSSAFTEFKEFDRPRALDKNTYGRDVGTIRSEGDGFAKTYFVDPDDLGPAAEFSFANPDFNFRSLRGNLVFRWEYTPGSTLFFVWSQDQRSLDPFGNLDLSRDWDALFEAETDSIFLVKFTYWLGF